MIVIKYISLALAAGLAIGGAWKWNFTRDDPADPSRRLLTPAGKIFLPLFALSVMLSAITQVRGDLDARQASAEQKVIVAKAEAMGANVESVKAALELVIDRLPEDDSETVNGAKMKDFLREMIQQLDHTDSVYSASSIDAKTWSSSVDLSDLVKPVLKVRSKPYEVASDDDTMREKNGLIRSLEERVQSLEGRRKALGDRASACEGQLEELRLAMPRINRAVKENRAFKQANLELRVALSKCAQHSQTLMAKENEETSIATVARSIDSKLSTSPSRST